VEVEADFEVKARDSGTIKRRLRRLLKENNFEEKNFTFQITKVDKRKKGGVSNG
jgi:hypothetical protein